MKPLLLFLTLCLSCQTDVLAQTEFILDASQSMIMTGKGMGQDATINPFYGEDCFAIVKNLGKQEFYVRIQKEKKIIKQITVPKGETKKFKLLKDQELYLDPNPQGISKASVDYEAIQE
ncbi:MAG: hypothetical protein WBG46_05200 [Nonlabens sp.]